MLRQDDPLTDKTLRVLCGYHGVNAVCFNEISGKRFVTTNDIEKADIGVILHPLLIDKTGFILSNIFKITFKMVGQHDEAFQQGNDNLKSQEYTISLMPRFKIQGNILDIDNQVFSYYKDITLFTNGNNNVCIRNGTAPREVEQWLNNNPPGGIGNFMNMIYDSSNQSIYKNIDHYLNVPNNTCVITKIQAYGKDPVDVNTMEDLRTVLIDFNNAFWKTLVKNKVKDGGIPKTFGNIYIRNIGATHFESVILNNQPQVIEYESNKWKDLNNPNSTASVTWDKIEEWWVKQYDFLINNN